MDAGFRVGRGGSLVGRDEELAEVQRGLADGGCLIAGRPGVGKSRLAAEAAAATDRRVVRVVATEAAASMPFGAFGHLLPPGAGDGPQVSDVLAALRGLAGGEDLLLYVDDAHLLDAPSSAALLAVAETRTASIVATVRTPDPQPDALVALWKDRRVVRIDLQPLAPAETGALVSQLLDGPVHPTVPSRIHDAAQGNPLYTTELVTAALRTGALAVVAGRWQLGGERLELGHLRELIGAHLDTISVDARTALQLLAIAGPLQLDHLEELVPSGAIEELELAQLVVTTDDRSARVDVELAHPLYGEAVMGGLSATAARRHRRELAAVLTRRGQDSESDRLRIATWLLEAGSVDRELFVGASAAALRRGAPPLAARLAEALLDGGDFEVVLSLARARCGEGRWDEAADLLERCEPQAAEAGLEDAALYLDLRCRTLHRGTRAPGPAAELLDRAAGWHDGTLWQAIIADQRGWVALVDARPGDAVAHLEPHLEDEALPVRVRFNLLGLAVYCYARLGRVDRGDEIEAFVQELARAHPDSPWEAGAVSMAVDAVGRSEVYVDPVGVRSRLDPMLAYARQTGDRPLARLVEHTIADTHLRQGHCAIAQPLHQRVFDEMQDGLTMATEPYILMDLVWDSSLLGRLGDAERWIAELEARIAPRPVEAQRWRVRIEHTRAMVDVVAGRHSAARSRFLAVAADAGQDLEAAGEALYAALRVGADPAVCARELRGIADAAGSPVLELWAAHAEAVAGGDGRPLFAVAEQLEEAGLDLFAAEAATQAAELLTAAGRREPARRATALAARCAERCAGVVTPILAGAAQAEALTGRELEIATLVARGLSNAEVAAELVLSVRSVETYVLRACRKLGFSNRRQLAEALHVDHQGAG